MNFHNTRNPMLNCFWVNKYVVLDPEKKLSYDFRKLRLLTVIRSKIFEKLWTKKNLVNLRRLKFPWNGWTDKNFVGQSKINPKSLKQHVKAVWEKLSLAMGAHIKTAFYCIFGILPHNFPWTSHTGQIIVLKNKSRWTTKDICFFWNNFFYWFNIMYFMLNIKTRLVIGE